MVNESKYVMLACLAVTGQSDEDYRISRYELEIFDHASDCRFFRLRSHELLEQLQPIVRSIWQSH